MKPVELERFITIFIYLAPVNGGLIFTPSCRDISLVSLFILFFIITLLASEIDHLDRAAVRVGRVASDDAVLAVAEVGRVQLLDVWTQLNECPQLFCEALGGRLVDARELLEVIERTLSHDKCIESLALL